MTKKGQCRICRFWEQYPYKVSERELFEKKCREGVSLRKLELLLESYGIRAKKDLISKHIRVCMNVQVSQQREIEKSIKKEGLGSIGRKLRQFILPVEPKVTESCLHTNVIPFFDIASERIFSKCTQCGKVLERIGEDPRAQEKRQRKARRNEEIYRSLGRK